MDELTILRHGIAVEHGTPGIPDDDRQLTPKGEKRMREIAAGLAEIGLELDKIVTSPLPRARRTAEIVALALDLEDRLETADVLRAGGPAQAAADWLRNRQEARLMIVGHNPMLDELLSLLVLGDPHALPFSLKKGAVAALHRWTENPDRFDLDWLAPPRLLRRREDG
jgi:phosphohistidine phosphatase